MVQFRITTGRIREFLIQEAKIATSQLRTDFQGGMFPESRFNRGRLHSSCGTLMVTR